MVEEKKRDQFRSSRAKGVFVEQAKLAERRGGQRKGGGRGLGIESIAGKVHGRGRKDTVH